MSKKELEEVIVSEVEIPTDTNIEEVKVKPKRKAHTVNDEAKIIVSVEEFLKVTGGRVYLDEMKSLSDSRWLFKRFGVEYVVEAMIYRMFLDRAVETFEFREADLINDIAYYAKTVTDDKARSDLELPGFGSEIKDYKRRQKKILRNMIQHIEKKALARLAEQDNKYWRIRKDYVGGFIG